MVKFGMRLVKKWYLKQNLLCHKSNTLPESMRGKSAEDGKKVFLLSTDKKYFLIKENK